MKVSKNISRGDLIKNPADLYSLSVQNKSVVVQYSGGYWVKPAAFMIHWSVAKLLGVKLYHAVKDNRK